MRRFALAAAVAALSFLPAPAEASLTPRGTCRSALKMSLKDPRSLEIPWGGIVEGDNIVRISYRARNGFGGMMPGTFYCEFDSSGSLIRIVDN